jgi:hypothetical protein
MKNILKFVSIATCGLLISTANAHAFSDSDTEKESVFRCVGTYNNFEAGIKNMKPSQVMVILQGDHIELGFLPMFSGRHKVHAMTANEIMFEPKIGYSFGSFNLQTGKLWLMRNHPIAPKKIHAIYDGTCSLDPRQP